MSEEISEEIASIDLEIDAEEIDALEVDVLEVDVLEVDALDVEDELVPDVEIAVEEALKVRPATTKRSGEEVVDMAEESDPDDV